jgi:hypothetical protein
VGEGELARLADQQRQPDPADGADQDVLRQLEVAHPAVADQHGQEQEHHQQGDRRPDLDPVAAAAGGGGRRGGGGWGGCGGQGLRHD